MKDLAVFENKEFGKVRVVMIDNEPWFVGKDVAEILGYKNVRDAILKHIDEDDKNTVAFRDGNKGNPNLTVINESGVYSLILSSKLPTAKKFKHWVTSEVLPTIRNYGMYATAELLQSPDFLIMVAQKLKADKERIEALEGTVSELAPKANYCDIILGTPDLVPITLIAKDYGLTAQWLNKYLCDKKVQYKMDKTYVLTKKYADKGYTGTKTDVFSDNFNFFHSNMHTYWTQKGRLLIYELLKDDGIYPIMEQMSEVFYA